MADTTRTVTYDTRGALTPEAKRLISKGARCYVVFDPAPDRQVFDRDRMVVTLRVIEETRPKGFETLRLTTYHEFMGFRGFVGCGRQNRLGEMRDYGCRDYSEDEENLYRPDGGLWGPLHTDHTAAIFAATPSGALLSFQARLDYHTAPAHAEKSLHGDALYMTARKGERHLATWILDEAMTAHNSSRFGWGRP